MCNRPHGYPAKAVLEEWWDKRLPGGGLRESGKKRIKERTHSSYFIIGESKK